MGKPVMPQQTTPISLERKAAKTVLETAERLHALESDWLVFFREVLGADGVIRKTFSDAEAMIRFECTPEYARIKEMLEELRSSQRDLPSERETTRVVTVRMPRSLHSTLKAEAGQMGVSINTLCISKLMKLIDEQEHRDMKKQARSA
ncbi:MAG: hypothetical protein ACKOYJ_12300 [Planctomycetia bacterium]